MSPDLDTARSLGSGRNLSGRTPSLSQKSQGSHDLPSLINDFRSCLDPGIDEDLRKGGEEGLTDQVNLLLPCVSLQKPMTQPAFPSADPKAMACREKDEAGCGQG